MTQNHRCDYPAQTRVFRLDDSNLDTDSPVAVSVLSSDHSEYSTYGHYDSGCEDYMPYTQVLLGERRDRGAAALMELRDSSSPSSTSSILIPRSIIMLQDPADSFSFLLTFTRNEGIVPVFESDTVLQQLKKASEAMLERSKQFCYETWNDESLRTNSHLSTLAQNVLDPALDIENVMEFSEGLSSSPPPGPVYSLGQHSSVFHQNTWADDPLAAKSLELVRALQSFEPNSWSLAMELECAHFFSPPKVRIFLEAYWSIWSPHWPALHRPTFDPLATPLPLLAALIIVGACHSPNPVDREDAKHWYDAVEDLVYCHLNCLSVKWTSDKLWLRKKSNQRQVIQAIQAAYAVSVYQNWNGTITAQSRTRRERWDTLVNVCFLITVLDIKVLTFWQACRSFGFSRVKHDDEELSTISSFEWLNFVANEEAVR